MAGTIKTRGATANDFPAISEIHQYYVLNTVITFVEQPYDTEYFVSAHQSITTQGLPYIVAEDTASGQLVGYTYAQPFRGVKQAYRFTAELTLLCHPDHRGKGIGSLLLGELIRALSEPKKHTRYRSSDSSSPGRDVKQVIAVMAVDETAKDGGLALKRFYEKNGFELLVDTGKFANAHCSKRGHLVKVGYKFDRWVDTMYLQRTL